MLGKSGLVVSALGIGTLQWGDPQCGFNKQYSKVSYLTFKLHRTQLKMRHVTQVLVTVFTTLFINNRSLLSCSTGAVV